MEDRKDPDPVVLRPQWLYINLLVVALVVPFAFGGTQTEKAGWMSALCSLVTMVFVWVTLELQRQQLAQQRQTLVTTNKAVRENADATSRTANEMTLQRQQMEGQLAAMHEQFKIMRAAYLGANMPLLQLSLDHTDRTLELRGVNVGSGSARVTGLWVTLPGDIRSPLIETLKALAGRVGLSVERLEPHINIGGVWKPQDSRRPLYLQFYKATPETSEAREAFLHGLADAIFEIEYTDMAKMDSFSSPLTVGEIPRRL